MASNNPYPLKKSSSYKEVATKGNRRRLSSWLQLQVMSSADSKNYFGITVSRKVATAVVRNKLKRWVKNCVQNEKWPQKYQGCVVVFVFKPQAEPGFFTKIKYSEFKSIFSKI